MDKEKDKSPPKTEGGSSKTCKKKEENHGVSGKCNPGVSKAVDYLM
jgi:hypothetical protein